MVKFEVEVSYPLVLSIINDQLECRKLVLFEL